MISIGTLTVDTREHRKVPEPSTLKDAAQKLEANFIAEMLKAANFGESSGPFTGGIGENQFSSYLRQAQAERMAENGGIGLSEAFVKALTKAAEV